MFFTQEDFRKIQEWLKASSIKDSEFIETKTPEFEDIVTIVQEGINKKVNIKDLFAKGLIDFIEFPETTDTNPNDEIHIIQDGKTKKVKVSTFIADNVDFLNVTKAFGIEKCTLSEAAMVIPNIFRKTGLEITFIAPSGNWMTYQYTSNSTDEASWLNEDNWSNALVNAEGLVLDNDTLVMKSGAAEVRDSSLKRIKLAEEVTNELDGLQNQINIINSGGTDVSISVSNNYIYSGYPLDVTIVGKINLPTLITKEDVKSIGIYSDSFSKETSKVDSVEVTTEVSATTKFVAKVTLGSPYDITKISPVALVTSVSPIYIGVANNNLSTSQYVSTISKENYLYSKDKPISSLIGESYTLEFGTSQRAVILTATDNLGAKSNGFDFPFDKYEVSDNMYLYVSKNTYSNQSQLLTFETKQY